MKHKLIDLFAILTLAVSWLAPAAAAAQTEPCSQDAGPARCVDVSLYPTSLSGDLYVDGVLAAAQVSSARLSVAPGEPHLIEVMSVTDTTEGFGDLHNYGDASQPNVSVAAGRVRTVAAAKDPVPKGLPELHL